MSNSKIFLGQIKGLLSLDSTLKGENLSSSQVIIEDQKKKIPNSEKKTLLNRQLGRICQVKAEKESTKLNLEHFFCQLNYEVFYST